MAYQVKKGFMWNPLRKIPRNMPCPCGSGKKFKKCHYLAMPAVLPENAFEPEKKK